MKIKWVGGIGWFKDKDGSWWAIRKTPYKEIPMVEVNWLCNKHHRAIHNLIIGGRV